MPASQVDSGVLAICDVVAASESLTPLESLLNRLHPGRVRRLPCWRLRWKRRNANAQAWMVFRKSIRMRREFGNVQHWVAVAPDRDAESVRRFGCFTADLHALADWLECCRIKTVAMESTGVYWIARYEVLESRGCEGLPSECSASQELARPQNRRQRLPVVAAVAQLLVVDPVLSATK